MRRHTQKLSLCILYQGTKSGVFSNQTFRSLLLPNVKAMKEKLCMRFVSLHLKQRQHNKNNINNEWFTELATSGIQLHSTTLAETLLNDILVKKLNSLKLLKQENQQECFTVVRSYLLHQGALKSF